MKLSDENKLRLKVIFIAFLFGIGGWVVDAIIDHFFFFNTEFENLLLFHLSPHMQFERIMIILTFMAFGAFISSYIIKQKKSELLKEKHDLLETTIESLAHPFYVIDAKDFSIVLANTATNKFISGINSKCYAITHKRDTPCGGAEHNCPLEIVKRTKKATVIEHTHYDNYGNSHVFEVHGHPIFDDDGNVIQMIEYSIEISERKKLEKKLIQRTTELKSLIDQSPLPIAIYGISGELLEINNQWRVFFENNGLGSICQNILENEYLINGGYLKQIKKIVTNGGILKTEPIFSERENKTLVFNIYDIKDEDGNVHRIVCQLEDITNELKRAEMNRELELQKKISAVSLDILESERKRVSKELHDQIGQKLLLAKLELEMIEHNSKTKRYNLKNAKEQILDVSKDIKSVIFSLHPAELEDYGLIDAIDLMVQKFSELAGIKTSFKHFGKYIRINKKIELNIYRIVQEAFNNISKHSKAKSAEVELHFKPELISVVIKDDGIGFSPPPMNAAHKVNGNRYGLISMHERTKISGGDLSLQSESGKGTQIQFNIPIRIVTHEKN